jgi:hypothetical protein
MSLTLTSPPWLLSGNYVSTSDDFVFACKLAHASLLEWLPSFVAFGLVTDNQLYTLRQAMLLTFSDAEGGTTLEGGSFSASVIGESVPGVAKGVRRDRAS